MTRASISLRTKLAVALAAAALLPLVLVSAVGFRVALGRMEKNLLVQIRQTSKIALNLLLRQVQSLSSEAVQLASNNELHALLRGDPTGVSRFLQTSSVAAGGALIEVVSRHGAVAGRALPRERGRHDHLFCRRDSEALVRALDYEQYLTVTTVGGELVIQASAPIVDSGYTLRGAVVATAPLNNQMADYIKGVVGAEIGFLRGATPVASTFFDENGQRMHGIAPPGRLAERVLRERAAESIQVRGGGEEYAVAFAPLQTVDGQRVGMLAVGLSRGEFLRARRSAIRSLFLGAAGSLIFALGLAYLIGSRITTPLQRLHRSTQAIAAGNLEQQVAAETRDEIGDLARAFQTMTDALRANQERLAARMREIHTLHQIGRAVSRELDLDRVLRQVVTEMTDVLGAERGGLLLITADGLELRAQVGLADTGEGGEVPPGWLQQAEAVGNRHAALVEGTTLAVPLETRDRGVGVLVVARRENAAGFSEADLRLVVSFADQAAAAIENARLYDEVKAFSVALERKVQERTAELMARSEELARTIGELKDTQAALVHSERMAGLGLLVAGVAHEVNTPAGAIQGSVQALGETIKRLLERLERFIGSGLSGEEARELLSRMLGARESPAVMISPAEIRRQSRELATILDEQQVADAQRLARRLLEAGAAELAAPIARLSHRVAPELVVGLVEDLAFIERSALGIQKAIASIVRIVRALKTYAHADQENLSEVDLIEGVETTLTILHNQLRYGINVVKRYHPLPRVRVFADELNQVWTNLIHNAIQAMNGAGALEIETFQREETVGVRVIDEGPGIPAEVLPRIFEPFFTTKAAGEGSGLGLGIARQIVEKHGGRIEVESHPGRTVFTVFLPLDDQADEGKGGSQ